MSRRTISICWILFVAAVPAIANDATVDEIGLLRTVLRDQDALVVKHAAIASGDAGYAARTAIDDLRKLLTHSHQNVRSAAASALDKIDAAQRSNSNSTSENSTRLDGKWICISASLANSRGGPFGVAIINENRIEYMLDVVGVFRGTIVGKASDRAVVLKGTDQFGNELETYWRYDIVDDFLTVYSTLSKTTPYAEGTRYMFRRCDHP